MRRGAYPEIGRRITISQGSGRLFGEAGVRPGTRKNGSILASTLRRRVDDELVVGPLGRSECVLDEAHDPLVRVIEQTKSAFAALNGLLVPGFGEKRAFAAKRVDEDLDLGVAKRAGEVGAKF